MEESIVLSSADHLHLLAVRGTGLSYLHYSLLGGRQMRAIPRVQIDAYALNAS